MHAEAYLAVPSVEDSAVIVDVVALAAEKSVVVAAEFVVDLAVLEKACLKNLVLAACFEAAAVECPESAEVVVVKLEAGYDD